MHYWVECRQISKNVTPRLKNWEKQYPLLERKIRYREDPTNVEIKKRNFCGGKTETTKDKLAPSSGTKKKSVSKKKRKEKEREGKVNYCINSNNEELPLNVFFS